MNITLILSSIREGRLADAVLSAFIAIAGKDYKFTLVDPLEYKLPLLNKRYFEMEAPEENFKKLHELFSATDGFIFITAEYNHSVPPALKNMIDHYGPEFKRKSAGIISYSNGPVGGARSSEHLRLILSTLGMLIVPVSPAWGLANKAGQPEGLSFEQNFLRSCRSFLKEFNWLTEALKIHREKESITE